MSKKKERRAMEQTFLVQKQQQEDEEFERELQDEIEREVLRREEDELDPITKEEKQKIEQGLIDKRQKLKDKEKLLQITQKYYIGGGNNYQVVKNQIKQRYWWTPAYTEDFTDANFIWTSWKRDKHIDYLKSKSYNHLNQPLKIYNRIDNNKQLTNKKGLFLNMKEYYQAIGVDPFTVLPVTYLVKNTGDVEFQRFAGHYKQIADTQRENGRKLQ
tara:strand:- start:64 stop:708 length:645 start_codon:yes stop_codon:yes gene_type:complete